MSKDDEIKKKVNKLIPATLAWYAKHEGVTIDEIAEDAEKYYELLYVHQKYPVERQIFRGMRSRATRPDKRHRDMGYAERGIYSGWLDRFGFLDFLNDVGPMPDYEKVNGHHKWSIDRIDNNKGYYPGNCRWATTSQQMRNRKNTRHVHIDGKDMILMEALEEYDVSENVYSQRIRYGWTVEEALKTPVRKRSKNGRRKYGRK